MQSHSFNKFIVLSIAFHLLGIAGVSFFTSAEEKSTPVEISFGTGNSRGGSSPLKVASAPQRQEVQKPISKTPKILKTLKSLGTIKTDAPVIAKNLELQDEVKKTDSAIHKNIDSTTGHGLGTGIGSGTGTTSGSGAGFNDPKIRFRGMIHQLVNSKKQYPRKARSLQQEGRVMAKIKLSKDGKLLEVVIVESSEYQILANATLEAIKGIEKFPEIPNELGLNEITLNIPFEYELTNGDLI